MSHKATILELIGEQRSLSALDLLAESLEHPEPKIWQTALDGIVAIADPRSIEILKKVKAHLSASSENQTRIEWIDEAIEQLLREDIELDD